jgi:hypothetical protein
VPGGAIAVLHQLFGNPGYIVGADYEIWPVRPEAGCPESPVRAPSLADSHHRPRGIGVEHAAAATPPFGSNPCEISPYLTHESNPKLLMI